MHAFLILLVLKVMLYIPSPTGRERKAASQWPKDGKRVSWCGRCAAMRSACATIHVAM